MKVGDLVKIAPHCKNKHRMAIVVRTETWERNAVWIKYMDLGVDASAIGRNDNGYARIANLILISEVPNERR
tara:strand:+ start:633 stop:848 length:216 start_codon:yes stop_codon:yes gene_type:complete